VILHKTIGIFEAKTHFSQVCDQVNSSGQALLVERRGKPLVVISPAETALQAGGEDILSAWRHWAALHPEEEGDFPDISTMRENKKVSAFE